MRAVRSIHAASTGALVLDVLAMGLALTAGATLYPVAAMLHVAGAYGLHRALRTRLPQRASAQLAFTAALWLPVLGPLLAWILPHPNEPLEDERARTLLEDYDRWVRYDVEPPARGPFTGDVEHDFVLFASVESYDVLLRYGTVAQKREALRRLVDSEKPVHLTMVRRCLAEEDPEVRLLAYAELQRLEMRLYHEIDEARERAHAASEDPAARAAPILAHRRLAVSGVLDEAMSDWHAREATLLEEQFEAESGSVADAAGARAEFDQQAAVAFRRRDFAHVRAYGHALVKAGRRPPAWIRALGVDREEEAA